MNESDNILLWASRYGRTGVVKLLVEHGADVNARDNFALRHASEYGYTDIINLLNIDCKK